ncbi:type 1 fimbrial major subunit FimA [Morganella morganii]|nr:type 1 fimbrial major subunit FimA [Morganella morganii]SHM20328.1 major type 1 subunit fimbrin (pilin) [Morganella morganii]
MLNKQRLVMSVVALAVLSASQLSMAATVTGGTVHFTGRIVNAACAVSADSTDQTVNMGQYRTAFFNAKGKKSGDVPFSIKLEDCDTSVSTKASVSFSGLSSADDPTALQTSNISGGSAGAAKGVGIQIADHMGKVVKPDGSVFSTEQKLVDGVNVLNFSANYISTQATVTPGGADADATFTMQYQ